MVPSCSQCAREDRIQSMDLKFSRKHTQLIDGAVILEGLKHASWDIEKDRGVILPAGSFSTPMSLIASAWKPDTEQGGCLRFMIFIILVSNSLVIHPHTKKSA